MFYKIVKALDLLVRREPMLINTGTTIKVNEESVNHLLAKRISEQGRNIDVEYNVDQVFLGKKGFHELGKALRPDIISHQRGVNTGNSAVIECKWNATASLIEKDLLKLIYFSLSPTYSYDNAYFVNYQHNVTDITSDVCDIAIFSDIKACAKKLAKHKKNYVADIKISPSSFIVDDVLLSIFPKISSNITYVDTLETHSAFKIYFDNKDPIFLYIVDDIFYMTYDEMIALNSE